LVEVYHLDISGFDEIATFELNEKSFAYSLPEKHNLNKINLLKSLYFLQKGNKELANAYLLKINLRYIYSADKHWVDELVAKIKLAC
jgi:hypothetical protein